MSSFKDSRDFCFSGLGFDAGWLMNPVGSSGEFLTMGTRSGKFLSPLTERVRLLRYADGTSRHDSPEVSFIRLSNFTPIEIFHES